MAIPLGRAAAETERHEVAEAHASFEMFFERTHQRLFGGLCLVTGNRHEAEEIMQDAYLKLWERWERVSEMDDPTGFLFRTAMNGFRSRYRRASLAIRRRTALAQSVDDLAAVEDRDEVVLGSFGRSAPPSGPRSSSPRCSPPSEEAGRLLGVKAATVRAHATRARAGARASLEEQP